MPDAVSPPELTRGATVSGCGTWRYDLTRRWAVGNAVLWVLLNPSQADGWRDDQTVRQIVTFSRGSGFPAAVVVNLYALRATSPARLADHPDPVGPGTDQILAAHAANHELVIVAWGATCAFPGRDGRRRHAERIDAVLAIVGQGELRCLGRTRQGQPRHPCRLGAGAQLQGWDMPGPVSSVNPPRGRARP
jgi:hypothetical protein